MNFFEYEKDGWTYHAKGLWYLYFNLNSNVITYSFYNYRYYLPESRHPNLTLIGSSNFGERSVNRDLETQICLVTSNSSLRSRLQAEADRLYSLSKTAEQEITARPVPRWVQAVVKIFRNFF